MSLLMIQLPLTGQYDQYIGRWDLTIEKDGETLPSWLEISKSGRSTLVGRFVYAAGSARPISHVKIADDGTFSFEIPPQWDLGTSYLRFTGTTAADVLRGTMVYTDGNSYPFKGVRAPLLVRSSEPIWGRPIALFNGQDLSGWHVKGNNQWVVDQGILKNQKAGGNLISDQTFTDFKLRVVFRYPAGSNSGVYLRGRYEVQIEDNEGMYPTSTLFGGIYGFLTPNTMAAKSSGEWQEYQITLIGRRVTIVANGHEIITDQIIPGITGGALDSDEGAPGPIFIQGDHGPIEFQLIELTPGL